MWQIDSSIIYNRLYAQSEYFICQPLNKNLGKEPKKQKETAMNKIKKASHENLGKLFFYYILSPAHYMQSEFKRLIFNSFL